MKTKSISLILLLSVFMLIAGGMVLKKYENETLIDAKWSEKEDALLAITIDGKESDNFPTTSSYNGTVTCSNGSGTAVWNGSKWIFNVTSITKNKTRCNVEFTKKPTVYDKVLADYAKNNGVSKTTDENGKEVYYYVGNITNNNLILNNFCWKMGRTTETNGVKLLYNGLYNSSTKCNNTGDDTEVEKYYVPQVNATPTYLGYMYNKVYEKNTKTSDNSSYVFGSSVSYTNGVYTLNNTKTDKFENHFSGTTDSSYDNGLDNYHYTCFSTSRTCSSVSYIYSLWYSSSLYILYLTLENGNTIETALNEMLFADDVNLTNSKIKNSVDNWYKTNMTSATNYLENAIFCANRTIKDYGGFNPNGGNLTSNFLLNQTVLTCANKTDQYTLKVSAGGTANYGNNALDYPVGLYNVKEVLLSSNGNKEGSFLTSNNSYYLINNFGIISSGFLADGFVTSKGLATSYVGVEEKGIRPVVSLRTDIILTGGTGEPDNPYTVSLP